jgi:hypothetical protein
MACRLLRVLILPEFTGTTHPCSQRRHDAGTWIVGSIRKRRRSVKVLGWKGRETAIASILPPFKEREERGQGVAERLMECALSLGIFNNLNDTS